MEAIIVFLQRRLLGLTLLCIFSVILLPQASGEVGSRENKRRDGLFGRKWNLSPNGRCKLRTEWNFPVSCVLKWKFIETVLSLFTVYQWNNGLCTATSGEYGNCLPQAECLAKGGIPGGPCAEGYGLCCVCRFFILSGWLHIFELNYKCHLP